MPGRVQPELLEPAGQADAGRERQLAQVEHRPAGADGNGFGEQVAEQPAGRLHPLRILEIGDRGRAGLHRHAQHVERLWHGRRQDRHRLPVAGDLRRAAGWVASAVSVISVSGGASPKLTQPASGQQGGDPQGFRCHRVCLGLHFGPHFGL